MFEESGYDSPNVPYYKFKDIICFFFSFNKVNRIKTQLKADITFNKNLYYIIIISIKVGKIKIMFPRFYHINANVHHLLSVTIHKL